MRTNDDANLVQVSESDPDYPTILRDRKAVQQYPCFRAIGNLKLLTDRLLGLVCSKRCPGNAILRTYELAKALRDAQIPVIGGFHSPMEKECLDLLLHGTQPVVVCPARSLEAMKLPRAWRSHISAGRLLLISSFAARHRRATGPLAEERNRLVGALASEIIVPHAEADGRAAILCRALADNGVPVWTFDLPENEAARKAGAIPTTPHTLARRWKSVHEVDARSEPGV